VRLNITILKHYLKQAFKVRYGSLDKAKERLIGKRLRTPFLPHKFGNDYQRILQQYYQDTFLSKIAEVASLALKPWEQEDVIKGLSEEMLSEGAIKTALLLKINQTWQGVFFYHTEAFVASLEKTSDIKLPSIIPLDYSNSEIRQDDYQMGDGDLEGWVEENLQLIKKLNNELLPQLKDYLLSAFKGEGRSQYLAETIQKITGFTEQRSSLIANDQVLKLYGQLNKHNQTKVGIDDYIWRTAGDDRVRPRHEERDDKQFNWHDGLLPGEEVRCRCTGEGVIGYGLFD
jgi:SPP1 gp7 family putative phage head morphogenesis protein